MGDRPRDLGSIRPSKYPFRPSPRLSSNGAAMPSPTSPRPEPASPRRPGRQQAAPTAKAFKKCPPVVRPPQRRGERDEEGLLAPGRLATSSARCASSSLRTVAKGPPAHLAHEELAAAKAIQSPTGPACQSVGRWIRAAFVSFVVDWWFDLSRQAAQIVTSTGWAGASSAGHYSCRRGPPTGRSHHSRLFRTALLGPGCATSPGSGRSWSWLPSAWRPPINLTVVATAPERAVAPGQASDEAPGWARYHLCQDLTASKAYTPMLLGEILDKKDVNFGGRDEQARRAEPWLVVASGRHKGQEVLKAPRKPPWRAHAAKLSWQVMRRPCRRRSASREARRRSSKAGKSKARPTAANGTPGKTRRGRPTLLL